MKSRLFALIYMSSYKIQLDIVNLKTMEIVETVNSPSFVQVGTKSEVLVHDMGKICRALESFKEKLAEYRISRFKFYGNQQLIDELAASYIADQIKTRTGMEIQWLSSSQIVYAKVLSGIKSIATLPVTQETQAPIFLLSTGSAMINLSLFKKGKFASSWDIPLGPEEIQQIDELTSGITNNPVDVIGDYIYAHINHLARQIKPQAESVLVIQHDSALNNKFMPQDHENGALKISHRDFRDFYQQAVEMPAASLMAAYQLDPAVSSHTLPNLVAIDKFMQIIKPESIYLTDMSVVSGLLGEEAQIQKSPDREYGDIIMTFAQNMARRYLVDAKHGQLVKEFALHIFDRLRKVHRLSRKERRLLALAATVDDIGAFVSQDNRYEKTAEILKVSPLIGLSSQENELVSEICRYQTITDKPGSPNIGGRHYRHLDSQNQLKIAKLAAILRLAVALDASHRQKIKKIIVSLKQDELLIRAKTNDDLTVERWAFNKRSQLFADVFGIKVRLKQEGMNRQ